MDITILMEYFTFFHTVLNIWYIFYTYNTSQFRLVMFQVFNNHMWPVATVLDSAAQMLLRHPRWDSGWLCMEMPVEGGRGRVHSGSLRESGLGIDPCLFQDGLPA